MSDPGCESPVTETMIIELDGLPCHVCGLPADFYIGVCRGQGLTLPCQCGLPSGKRLDTIRIKALLDDHRLAARCPA